MATNRIDWTTVDQRLQTLHTLGIDPANMAKQLNIGPTTVRERLITLGLLQPRPKAPSSAASESTEPYEFHPLAALFPLMTGQPYEDLKADIAAQGQREPVWLYEGKIVDGRNRYQACQELGRPCLVRQYQGDQPLAFIVSLNLQRRHLTDSQRAIIGEKLATMRQGERTDLSDRAERFSQGQAADLMQISPDLIGHAKTVREQGDPALQAAVASGEIPVTPAATLAKEDPDTQRDVVQEVKSGRQRSVGSALRARRNRSPRPPKPAPKALEQQAREWAERLNQGFGGFDALLKECIAAGGVAVLVPAMDRFMQETLTKNTEFLAKRVSEFAEHLRKVIDQQP
jgi:ParB-like chromosome segregation protein Spo0J